VSTERERERLAGRLTSLLDRARVDPDVGCSADLADFLVAHGAILPEPPEPEVKPGTVGTAIVLGEGPMRVGRIEPVSRLVIADAVWVSFASVHGLMFHAEGDVTDFVPDVVLSPADVDQLRLFAENDTVIEDWARGLGVEL
jgi:hypothetical protein